MWELGRLVPPPEAGDTGSEVSEWELRERREREEEQEVEAEELGAGEELSLFLPIPSFMASAEEQQELGWGWVRVSFVFSFVISGVVSSFIFTPLRERPGRRAKGSLQCAATARTADRIIGQNARRHDLYRSHAGMNKQKNQSSPRLPAHHEGGK